MSDELADLTNLDRLIHEPARLAIMAVLYGCESADFEFLLRATELTKGNLSAHTGRLEQGGYLRIEKSFRGKYPCTHYSLTETGRRAFQHYREMLRRTIG